MAVKKETLQTNRQIKVRLDKETLEALRDSAERRKEQHSVLGRMIIVASLKALRDTNTPIAHALQVAAEMATGIPEYRECEVKVRLTTEKFKEWRAIAVKMNVPHSILARVAIKGFLDAERNGAELSLDLASSDLLQRHDLPSQAKVLTPDQQKIQELEARIECLERERSILKQAATILMAG
jgi:trehalose/maltose hydrolase-like predicted phosphorylase